MDWRKLFARAVENWPAKVLSLALAIILFVFHRMSILETRFFSTSLIVERVTGMMPSSPYPGMIRVSLRGEANGIYSIFDEDIEAFVDMGEFESPGTYLVPVQWRKKGTALGVNPLQISVDPSEITFSLDYRMSKPVPLVANFRGQVESGYTMVSYTLNPTQVVIEGPVGLIGAISELYTEPIDLEGRRTDFTVAANIPHQNPLVIIRGAGTAEFSGSVTQIVPVRNILNVPITITGLMNGFTGELEVKTGSLHVEGENIYAVTMFDPSSDFLKVDCSEIYLPGIYILQVQGEEAEGVVVRIEPREVQIEISYWTGDEKDDTL